MFSRERVICRDAREEHVEDNWGFQILEGVGLGREPGAGASADKCHVPGTFKDDTIYIHKEESRKGNSAYREDI